MLIGLFLISFCLADSPIEYFMDREIRIFSSAANHIFLVRDVSKNTITHRSKFANLENMFSAFRISKDSTMFRIRTGEDFICDEDNNLTICKKPTMWKIKPVTLGYTISSSGKCLTIQSRTTMGLDTCTEVDDQIFDFRIANEDTKCDEEDKKKSKEIVIKMINTTKNEIVDNGMDEIVVEETKDLKPRSSEIILSENLHSPHYSHRKEPSEVVFSESSHHKEPTEVIFTENPHHGSHRPLIDIPNNAIKKTSHSSEVVIQESNKPKNFSPYFHALGQRPAHDESNPKRIRFI